MCEESNRSSDIDVLEACTEDVVGSLVLVSVVCKLSWAKCGGICGSVVRDPVRRSEGVLGRRLEWDLLVVPKDSVTQVLGSLVLVPVVWSVLGDMWWDLWVCCERSGCVVCASCRHTVRSLRRSEGVPVRRLEWDLLVVPIDLRHSPNNHPSPYGKPSQIHMYKTSDADLTKKT